MLASGRPNHCSSKNSNDFCNKIGPERSPWLAAFESGVDAVDGSSTRHVSAMDVGADKAPTIWRSYPFQVNGVDAEGNCCHSPAVQATTPTHCRMRGVVRDLIRGGHYGQRVCEPRLKAEHMGTPTNAAYVKKVLANSEPSTHGGLLPRGSMVAAAVDDPTRHFATLNCRIAKGSFDHLVGSH